MKVLLSRATKIVYILRDFSFAFFFLTMRALYPLIMYKFDVDFNLVLGIPLYAMLFLFIFFVAKTIIGILCFFLSYIKHTGSPFLNDLMNITSEDTIIKKNALHRLK